MSIVSSTTFRLDALIFASCVRDTLHDACAIHCKMRAQYTGRC